MRNEGKKKGWKKNENLRHSPFGSELCPSLVVERKTSVLLYGRTSSGSLSLEKKVSITSSTSLLGFGFGKMID